jgi:subtilisin family serine protease
LCTALLAVGCLATATAASADPVQATPSSCAAGGPDLRYLVVFPLGTPAAEAQNQITADCGETTIYYAPIAVAVATSADPTFADRMGPNRAYSAEAESYYDSDDAGSPGMSKKSDEIQSNVFSATTDPESVSGTNLASDQWDMAMIKANQANRIDAGSSRVLVGVLDSGVDPHQPNLTKEIDPAASAGCLSGAPDTSEAAWAPTTSAHGTHVAGTIAAADDGKGIVGVAPGVRIASVKVVDDNGYIYPEAAVCGFMWAAQNGMNIANNSYFIDPWIFTCSDTVGQNVVYTAVQRAVDYATNHGVLSIAAAGNQAVDLTNPGEDTGSPDNVDADDQQQRMLGEDCVQLPAGLKGVVTVSSVGADEIKAGYSSYGLGAIDVTAPGGDSHQHAADGDDCVLSTVPNGYATSCGTSMATPHVSGVAALLASTHPDATPGQLTQLLNNEATPVPCPADYDLNGTGTQDAYCTGDSTYNSFYGHGLVNALAAVTAGIPSGQSTANSATPSQPSTPPAGSTTGAGSVPSCTNPAEGSATGSSSDGASSGATSSGVTSSGGPSGSSAGGSSSDDTPSTGTASTGTSATGTASTQPQPPSTDSVSPSTPAAPPATGNCAAANSNQNTVNGSGSAKDSTTNDSATSTQKTESATPSEANVPPMINSLIPDGVW